MPNIVVPTDGRPIDPPGSEALVGVDANAFSIIGATRKMLRRAGASDAYMAAYVAEASSGDYDHVIETSMAYLDGASTDGAS